MSVKVQFVISDEAMDVINTSATERKRGEWLSSAIVDYHKLISGVTTEDGGEVGLLERIDSRLARMEKQMALLVAERVN